jgi:hypothetical protein
MGIGNILSGIGSLVGLIPGIGTAVGTGLNVVGSALGGEKKKTGSSLLETALPSLIQGGVGLLGGFLKGAQTEKEQKKAYETWQKSRATQFADLDKIMGKRYRTAKDLPTIDPMLKKLLVGRMSQYVSPEQTSKWGIDFSDILSKFGGGQAAGTPTVPPTSTPNIPNQMIGGKEGGRRRRGTPELAEDILGKYAQEAL